VNVSWSDQSHVNTRHEVLDWFELSSGVIALRPVLMYYVIEIGFSLFLSGSFRCFSGNPSGFLGLFCVVLNVIISSLFIVGEPPHRV
jgi:hypothetical protein